MADGVVALSALAADQVAGVAPRGGLEGARRGPGSGGGGCYRDGAAGERFLRRRDRGCGRGRRDRRADAGQHRLGRRGDRTLRRKRAWPIPIPSGGGQGGSGGCHRHRANRGRRCHGLRFDGCSRLGRGLFDPDRLPDPVDQAELRRLRLGFGSHWFGLRLRDHDALAGPFQKLPARPAERVAVLVVVPALLTDDHPVVTSTASVTLARFTISTLCVTWAGLAAMTSASSLVRLIVEGSSSVTRTRRAKFGEPGSAAPAVVELDTPPVSCRSTVPPVSTSTCSLRPLAVPRIR